MRASIFSRSSGGERLFALEVVEESLLGGRADPELRLGMELQDGRRQQVGARVAVDFEAFGVPLP